MLVTWCVFVNLRERCLDSCSCGRTNTVSLIFLASPPAVRHLFLRIPRAKCQPWFESPESRGVDLLLLFGLRLCGVAVVFFDWSENGQGVKSICLAFACCLVLKLPNEREKGYEGVHCAM